MKILPLFCIKNNLKNIRIFCDGIDEICVKCVILGIIHMVFGGKRL